MFHGGALQKLFPATITVCCVRQLEKTKIACRNDKICCVRLAFGLAFCIGLVSLVCFCFYSGDGDEKRRPVIIHRAILGSVERMIAILTENYGGKW